MKDKSIGLIVSIVSTVLALIGLVLYGGVLHTVASASALLICALIAGVLAVVAAFVIGKGEIPNVLAGIAALLTMIAAGVATAPMVTDIALVYAGLNPQSNIQGFITFIIVVLIAWVLGVVASFMGIVKKN